MREHSHLLVPLRSWLFFFSSCHAVGDRDTLRHSQQVNYWAYCSTAEGKLFILFFFELHIFWGKTANFRYNYWDSFFFRSFFPHAQQLLSVQHQIWEVKLNKLEESLLEKASSALKKNAKVANSRAQDSLIKLSRRKPIKHSKLLFWGSPKQHKSKE